MAAILVAVSCTYSWHISSRQNYTRLRCLVISTFSSTYNTEHLVLSVRICDIRTSQRYCVAQHVIACMLHTFCHLTGCQYCTSKSLNVRIYTHLVWINSLCNIAKHAASWHTAGAVFTRPVIPSFLPDFNLAMNVALRFPIRR